jgi:hypothetical protein
MRHAMRFILISGTLAFATARASVAADLYPAPPYHPPSATYVPVAAVLYNWTGFYIGGNLGAGWSQGSLSDTAGNTFTPNGNPSFLGGGRSVTTTSSGVALSLVSKPTSTGPAITTTLVTPPRA